MFRAAASPQAAAALCPCTEPPLDQTGDALSISLALLRDGIPRDAAVPAPSTAAREPPGEGSVMGEIAQKAPRERERAPQLCGKPLQWGQKGQGQLEEELGIGRVMIIWRVSGGFQVREI